MITRCREFDRLALTLDEARALQRAIEQRPQGALARAVRWLGPNEIQVRQHVGVLGLGERVLEIWPKVRLGPGQEHDTMAETRALMSMLTAAGALPWLEDDAPVDHTGGSLLEALVAAFAVRLEAALSRGIDRSYEVSTIDDAALRGRLRVADQIRVHRGLHHRFVQDRDLFETDTPLNRVLRATCSVLLGSTGRTDTRRRLTGALHLLEGVSDVPHDQLLERWPILHRRNEHYTGLLGFCDLILRGLTPGRQSSSGAPFSVLFPMDRVFEAYVGRQLQGALAPMGYEVRLQAQGFLARDDGGVRRLKLRPDIVVLDGREVVAVLDTKWKVPRGRSGNLELAASDAQQMLSYGHRWGCPRTVLVYPHRGAHAGARWESMRNPEAWQLKTGFVDVAADGANASHRHRELRHLVIGVMDGGVTDKAETTRNPNDR